MFDIKENLKKLPDCPGVYMHKDKLGNIIYIGKAVSLRNRVRQYFQSKKNMPPKVASMVGQIAEFEYITVESEMEALILECNLIKKHRPKYNILLRDDKTYPYIKVTKEEWPRIVKTRVIKKDGGMYFGPYSDVGAVNRIIDFLRNTFVLKSCSTTVFPKGYRPCLNYHIGECRGICTGRVSHEEYKAAVAEAVNFLRGHKSKIITDLKKKMTEASMAMEYERAAEYRDYIEAAEALAETQRVVLHHSDEADIVVRVYQNEGAADIVHMAVFNVRDGKLVGRETYRLDAAFSIDTDKKKILSTFINQHYGKIPRIPKEILVDVMPEDSAVLQQYLSEIGGHKVNIIKPERGEKKALVKLAIKDAGELAKSIDEKARTERERKESLGKEIHNVLCEMGMCDTDVYDGREYRVESYDISNTNGVDTVGAMVVFNGAKPDKQSYRKFRVRTVKGQDDYGSMEEVLSRRFLRVLKGDDRFSVLADLILMDGGKGHVTTALKVIEETGFDIPVAGMVKDSHHRTRALVFRVPGTAGGDPIWKEVSLADKPLLFKYIGTIQEEVHRFAIDYHHRLRSKNIEKSVLDEIEGIGQKRRKALLETFGSVDNIKKIALEGSDASIEKLASAPGMNRLAAEKVCAFFRMMV